MRREERLELRTDEGVAFHYPLASPLARMLAAIIDAMVVSLLGMLVWLVCRPLLYAVPDVALALGALATFAIAIGYPMLLEYRWRGQTIGKRLFRLRVIDKTGLRLTPAQVALRNLLRPVDQLPAFYLVGGVVCLLSRHLQRLGDLAANTVVVCERPVVGPRCENLLAGKYNSLRDDPLLVANLRRKVTMAEIDLAMQALLRRDSLNPEDRVKLFAHVAKHFREAAKLRAADFPIPDEQFVRNIVDVALEAKQVAIKAGRRD